MNIEYLREYIALSRQRSFRSTAKELHITQPALSNHIHILEKSAGSQLVQRQTDGGSRLTLAGQQFLEASVKIVSIYDAMLDSIKNLKLDISGSISIRTPRFEYSSPLLGYVSEFAAQHPDIEIIMKPWVDIDGTEDLAAGAVDCAYIGYTNREKACLAEGCTILLIPYTTTEVMLWIDKDHTLARQKTLSVADLDAHTILIPSNHKNTSWKYCVESIADDFGIDITINERFCDTLEDLALRKTNKDDIWLCDSSLNSFPPFRLRKERCIKRFSPRVLVPVRLGVANKPEDQATQLFISFLSQQFEASTEQPANMLRR
ncbi:MAG: LysR family transcriptional regulator [Coriobacteriales bacterium]|jgi:DNA-binding transcriptional LysR family regulator|nr:LysR family transcriptional regulator [Coriobacteriales bacterium]